MKIITHRGAKRDSRAGSVAELVSPAAATDPASRSERAFRVAYYRFIVAERGRIGTHWLPWKGTR